MAHTMQPSDSPAATPQWWAAAALALVGLAALLRFGTLGLIPPGLYFDEAMYCLDALTVGKSGHWPVFFPANYGREPLYIYSLAAAFAMFGGEVPVARLVSALWGTLAVAALVPVARRALGPAWALAAVLAMAVFRWPLHFSNTIFRAVMPPLFILLSVWFFLRWREGRRPLDAVVCGVALGTGLYTYTSFRLVPVMMVLWIVYQFSRGLLVWRRDARGIAVVIVSALVAVAPLSLHFARHPEHLTSRTGEISLLSRHGALKPPAEILRAVAGNARDIALMWTVRGDHVARHNLPHRPVFDWLTGVFFYAGIVWCVGRARREEWAFICLAWILTLSCASLFSVGAPNLLRMQGMTPAVVLVLVFGLRWAWQIAAPLAGPAIRTAAAAALLGFFATMQLVDYFVRFAHDPAVRREFLVEMFYDPAVAARKIAPEVAQMRVPAELSEHPTFRFVTHAVPNLDPYGPSDPVTSGSRPLGILTTMRSLDLASLPQRAELARLEALPEARRMATLPLTVERPEIAPVQRLTWAEIWVLDEPRRK
jgi:4-amino-4-deoxy-L-arabinose transferase-like glycosyltransferase